MLRSQMPDAATLVYEDHDARLDRQLQILGDLAELGLQAARTVVRQAEADALDASATALAYARVSRAVRLAIALQSELTKAETEQKGARRTPEDIRKARVERIVERVVRAEHPGDEDRLDALMTESADRLDDEGLYGDLMRRPLSELVARICADIGLEPDWNGLAKEFWAQEEVASGEPGWPLISANAASPACGRGGPRSGGEGIPPPLSAQASRLSTAIDGFP